MRISFSPNLYIELTPCKYTYFYSAPALLSPEKIITLYFDGNILNFFYINVVACSDFLDSEFNIYEHWKSAVFGQLRKRAAFHGLHKKIRVLLG